MSDWYEHFGFVSQNKIRTFVVEALLGSFAPEWREAVRAASDLIDHGQTIEEVGEGFAKLIQARHEQILAPIRAQCEDLKNKLTHEGSERWKERGELEAKLREMKKEKENLEEELESIRNQNKRLDQKIRNQNKLIADQHYRLDSLFGSGEHNHSRTVNNPPHKKVP